MTERRSFDETPRDRGMDREPSILLTNDDGIDRPGLRALADALSTVGTVTVVAPEGDRSAVGRTVSDRVTVAEHELGYSISGTPVDAVVLAIEALGLAPDVVVAGCNEGANLGGYVLGRSGTVSAAVEATFFDIPAIAVSLFIPEERWPIDTTLSDYRIAARATRHLVTEGWQNSIYEHADFLNVNVPLETATAPRMHVTKPSTVYEMTVHEDGDGYTVADGIWEYMASGAHDEDGNSDRAVVLAGDISVSPLSTPANCVEADVIHETVDAFGLDEPEPPRSNRQ